MVIEAPPDPREAVLPSGRDLSSSLLLPSNNSARQLKMSDLLPEYRESSSEIVVPTVRRVRQTFNAQKTKPLEFRLVQLRKLYWA